MEKLIKYLSEFSCIRYPDSFHGLYVNPKNLDEFKIYNVNAQIPPHLVQLGVLADLYFADQSEEDAFFLVIEEFPGFFATMGGVSRREQLYAKYKAGDIPSSILEILRDRTIECMREFALSDAQRCVEQFMEIFEEL